MGYRLTFYQLKFNNLLTTGLPAIFLINCANHLKSRENPLRTHIKKAYFLGVFVAAVTAFSFASCAEKGAKHRPGIDSNPEVRASENIADSFLVDNSKEGVSRPRISIRKSALDKEFLLQSATTMMPFLGNANSNKTRVVAFKRVENNLFMLEASQGHVVTNDIPQTFILASFPITGETRESLLFDFNAGMSRLFIAGEWRASDFEGTTPNQDSMAATVNLSYLAQASVSAKNELVVRQIAQLDLTPYNPDPTFKPTPTSDFKWSGFFEVAAQYDAKGVEVVNASKWSSTKPIVFSVSANTPESYKQAVKDGVRYWNRALGVTTIDAIDAPVGVNAPDFDHNVVQWIEWDEAGFAYADAQADPRTGEILHAQVYMTSVFAVSGLKSAKKLVDTLKPMTSDQLNAAGKRTSVALKGLADKKLCNRDTLQGLVAALEVAIEDGADDAKILKISQDYVREVVAHEIGHTLGLRHNFAGSMAMNFPAAEMNDKLKEYIAAGETPSGLITSSSVMEYQIFATSAMTGDLIRRGGEPLTYDLRAIAELYNPDANVPAAKPLFCTDTHTFGQYSDCVRFDVGSSAVDNSVYDLSVMQKMLTTVINDGSTDIPTVLLMPADFVANRVLRDRAALVKALSEGTELIRKRRPLEAAWPPVASEDIATEEKSFLNAEIERLGGINAVFPAIALPAAPTPAYETAAKNLANAFAKVEIESLKLPKNAFFMDGAIGEKILSMVNAKATEIVTATAGEPSDVDGIKLANFKYPLELRVAAAGLLSAAQGGSLEWGMSERAALKKTVSALVSTSFGQDGDAIDAATLKRPAARWVLEQRSVAEAIK